MTRPMKEQIANARADALRHHGRRIILSNQGIVELAYAVKEYIEIAVGRHLSEAQENCLSNCFQICRRMLERVDKSYLLPRHKELADFYQKDFESFNTRS